MGGTSRLAIVGAGPIGLEAALFAQGRGYDVTVLERRAVLANVMHWGHVRLFSPFGWNASVWGRCRLRDVLGDGAVPHDSEMLTGRETVEAYWRPLSLLPELRERIHEHSNVEAIGRASLWKGDCIGQPRRAEDAFHLLVRESGGQRTVTADYVLDCTGTYPNHNWMGVGGIPCPGESETENEIEYQLPDVFGADRASYASRRTLVVGSGYSAATVVVQLAQLADVAPRTEIVWLTRSKRNPPMCRIERDSLPERDGLAMAANKLALSSDGPVSWRPGRWVRRIDRSAGGSGFAVWTVDGGAPLPTFECESDTRPLLVDRIIANVGYRPDHDLYRELQVHECYASEGPMKLAAALLGNTSGDCATQVSHGAETLVNPEPGFFILGSKSYGRNSRFLLRIGLQQIVDAVSLLSDA